MRPETLFRDQPVALAVCHRVAEVVAGFGECELRTSKSQVAFHHGQGFAYVWRPARYLHGTRVAPAVLSIVLGRPLASKRFKQVSHPAPAHWTHHLEVRDAAEIDADVVRWLREAYDRADARAPLARAAT